MVSVHKVNKIEEVQRDCLDRRKPRRSKLIEFEHVINVVNILREHTLTNPRRPHQYQITHLCRNYTKDVERNKWVV